MTKRQRQSPIGQPAVVRPAVVFIPSCMSGILAGVVGLLVASLAIGLGALKQAKYNRDAYEAGEEYTADTYNPERDTCLRLPTLDQRNCIAQADQRARENERGEQDLVAQKVTALWTSIMGGAAVLGMALSIVGVFLVYTTFKATREGNKITREIGRAQIRAYLTCAEGTYEITKDDLSVSVALKNLGHSPALEVIANMDVTLYQMGGTKDHPRVLGHLPMGPGSDYVNVIPQGETRAANVSHYKKIPFMPEATDEDVTTREYYMSFWPLADKGRSFHVELVVTWVDVFGERHENKTFLQSVGKTDDPYERLPRSGSLHITPETLQLAKYTDDEDSKKQQ